MKASVFTILLFCASLNCYAVECKTEIRTFSISEQKQREICEKIPNSIFDVFEKCVFSTAQRYGATEQDVRTSSEQSLQGIFNLCSGGRL